MWAEPIETDSDSVNLQTRIATPEFYEETVFDNVQDGLLVLRRRRRVRPEV